MMTDALLTAIGRVAVESAGLEASLRYLVDDLAPMGDDAWFLWEGQPTDWLYNAALAILRGKRQFGRGDDWPERLESLLGRVKTLAELRNQVIHGQWVEDDGEWDKVVPRPWGGASTEDSLLCLRSRRLKEWTPQRWTVADVARLADEIATLGDALYDVREEYRNALMARWASRDEKRAE